MDTPLHPTCQPSVEHYYDIYFRMLGDLGFQPALPWDLISDLAAPSANSITVSPCRPAYGMNDWFASVSPDVARLYFNRPYAIFSAQKDTADNCVRNTDSSFLYSYLTAGINVYEMSGLKRGRLNVQQRRTVFHLQRNSNMPGIQESYCGSPPELRLWKMLKESSSF
jgi:hypothetical protein